MTSSLFPGALPLGALPPLTTEHWVVIAVVSLIASGLAWILQGRRLNQLHGQLADREKAHSQALASQAAEAAAAADALQRKLSDLAVAKAMLEERHTALVEKAAAFQHAAEKREKDTADRLMQIGAELAANRQLAAQLEPTRARIGDLENALAAERGRLTALQQTINITSTRASDFERRLAESQGALALATQAAAQRESELQAQLAAQAQAMASGHERLSTVDAEIAKMSEIHTSYQQQAESRIANLQRQVAAAEAKSALVQKEFMTAVGTLPAVPAIPAAAAPAGDRRVSELEAKITHLEAEARKKAREDGYKIAELEYRLTEAREAPASAPAPGSTNSAPLQQARSEALLMRLQWRKARRRLHTRRGKR